MSALLLRVERLLWRILNADPPPELVEELREVRRRIALTRAEMRG